MSEKIVRITDDKTKEPFKLFGNIEYKWFQVKDPRATDISFHIRPMRCSEKAVFEASKKALNRSMDYLGAVANAGLNADRFSEVPPKGATAEEIIEFGRKHDEDWGRVQRNLFTDLKAVEMFAIESKKVSLACIDMVKIGDFEKPFNEEMYEQITEDSVKVWLLDCIDKASTISDSDRLGLLLPLSSVQENSEA